MKRHCIGDLHFGAPRHSGRSVHAARLVRQHGSDGSPFIASKFMGMIRSSRLGHANTAMAPGTSDITLRPDMMLKMRNRRA